MLGGHTNSTGFVIRDMVENEEIVISSKNFRAGPWERFWNKKIKKFYNRRIQRIIGIISLIISILFSTIFLVETFSLPIWKGVIIGIICGWGILYFVDLFLVFVKSLFVLRKIDLREYHACEHKVINLLESDHLFWQMGTMKEYPNLFRETVEKVLTIENLQKESSTHPGCGSGPEFIQKHFTTKEPSREKLEEALEVAREYCGKSP